MESSGAYIFLYNLKEFLLLQQRLIGGSECLIDTLLEPTRERTLLATISR